MDKYKLTKTAFYLTGVTMSISANLSPLLFLTFRDMYNLSYTLLGFLVVINFFTQLLIDLIFTFFNKYFNIHRTVRTTPFIVFIGLILYAVLPRFFPDMAFLWIVVGTVIFSVASGLSEVLLSPVIAAIPSENPEREMSKLHSMFAWGVVGVVILSTLFLAVFGSRNWMYLALLWSIVPFIAFLMFLKAELPPLNNFSGGQKETKIFDKGIILCTLCIFFGGAAECTMSQWASGFIENAIGVPKVYGDVIGVALFAALLGMGRTLYSRFSKKIINILLFGMIGASVCYFMASLTLSPVAGIISCALTGIFTSMLWPGTLIYVEEKFQNVGVAIYALLAAGGDLGASLAPQLLGIISDKFSFTSFAMKISNLFSISTEQVSMRAGLLAAGLFPVAGVVCILYMKKHFKGVICHEENKMGDCRPRNNCK
ncbi:MAG: MFS transporter [Ruminococcaceae bacterium]|nr:MFS transporter [Oscillospiraceae bacterium]